MDYSSRGNGGSSLLPEGQKEAVVSSSIQPGLCQARLLRSVSAYTYIKLKDTSYYSYHTLVCGMKSRVMPTIFVSIRLQRYATCLAVRRDHILPGFNKDLREDYLIIE
ncbi:hypothetical protein TNCT_168821 [Trichonephila clavata]|uniref:Uncharacterized protein n=1 Tax=Trichonephila clavata TaxID=2740835 RepID=A0A8X6I8Z0_TRICU|nr:hypothetical protein TNCT_168821 [Trichonephila clavata]